MLTEIGFAALTGLALAAAPEAPRDTTFPAPEGLRLEVENRAGLIHVRGVDGDRVRVEAGGASRGGLRIRRTGSQVRVDVPERWRRAAEDEEVALRVVVPREASVRIRGIETRLRVEGVAGDVDAETIDADVVVTGPATIVRARTIDGDVVVTGARGSTDLYTADGDVRVTDVEGQLRAESIDGDLSLRGVRARRVDGSTTDGDILFEGTFTSGGSYRFATHDGDVWVAVPEGTGAVFEVHAPGEGMDAGFELPSLEADRRGRRYRFVLGDGSARVELSTFDGEVVLRRPGELPGGVVAATDGRGR